MSAQLWKVVGGADTGGILVRVGMELESPLEAKRLATGALVKELDSCGDRLRYKRVTGSGPAIGWVSVRTKDRFLLAREDALPVSVVDAVPQPLAEPNPQRVPNVTSAVARSPLPEPCSGSGVRFLARLCALADAASPVRMTFEGEHGLTFDVTRLVVEKVQGDRSEIQGLRVVAVNEDRVNSTVFDRLSELALSEGPYTVDFALMHTAYEHVAPWVKVGTPNWMAGRIGAYSIGADRWNATHCCGNCSTVPTMVLHDVLPEVFEAVLRYNETLRPLGGQAERILCCGSLAYIREMPASCSRWMPQLPRAVVYLHLAQQLAEPGTRAELLEAHPDAGEVLSVLASQVRAFCLEDLLATGALRPGDVVVTPPRADSGHTGHMYTLERPVMEQADDERCGLTPGCNPSVAEASVNNVVCAWVFIESRLKLSAVPPESGLPQMQGIRRNVRTISDLFQYCNRGGRPGFVLRLL